jgi:hypothetical protein
MSGTEPSRRILCRAALLLIPAVAFAQRIPAEIAVAAA